MRARGLIPAHLLLNIKMLIFRRIYRIPRGTVWQRDVSLGVSLEIGTEDAAKNSASLQG